ncbi:hypothetical protein [Acinetobacter sp. Marseille-Q1618]|uniref:hypothetical protein n=1 Tax=Acinetobacter sp. Marseille-Q1618 TaxID=2697502 RepID=UPI00156EBFA8|nr:hypothetical protein [Acinetobacter sp. Marseille-Q1618]
MSNATDSQKVADEKKGWKGLFIAFILSVLFLGIFYLAVTNEPDYMPSQQKSEVNQTSFKNAPVMSKEALAEAEKQRLANAEQQAPDANMKNMQHDNTETHAEHSAH